MRGNCASLVRPVPGDEMAVGLDRGDELNLLRAGGEDAIAELFERYRVKLLRMITLRLDCRLLSKVDGEDLLQETFVATVRRLQDYLDRPAVPFFVWIRQVACQILVDTHRRYLGAQMRDVRQEIAVHRAEGTGSNSTYLVSQLADSLTSPSQTAVRRELISAMHAALGRLAEVDREVLILRHLEGLCNSEVAQILQIDRYAASKRYLRALGRLKAAMPEFATQGLGP